MKRMGKCTKSGFTLVELLVSITIIMVLTVTAVVNYGNAQKNARDAKRKADLEKIRVALEMYKQDHGGVYPAVIYATIDPPLENYLDTVPTFDPIGCPYFYEQKEMGASYRLGAHMELERNCTQEKINPTNCEGKDSGECDKRCLDPGTGKIIFNYVIHSP